MGNQRGTHPHCPRHCSWLPFFHLRWTYAWFRIWCDGCTLAPPQVYADPQSSKHSVGRLYAWARLRLRCNVLSGGEKRLGRLILIVIGSLESTAENFYVLRWLAHYFLRLFQAASSKWLSSQNLKLSFRLNHWAPWQELCEVFESLSSLPLLRWFSLLVCETIGLA